MSFTKSPSMPDRHIVMLIEGPESSRKTTIALGAPGPLGILDVNRGLDIPEYEEAKAKKDIFVSTITVPHGKGSQVQAEAERQLDLFTKDVFTSLETYPWTFVDTGTNIWELCRLATMGAVTVKDLEADKKKRGQLNYDAPNSAMRQWLYYTFETKSNLILTAHQGEKYIGNVPSGQMIARGFKEVPEVVRQHIVLDKQFNCKIVKCRGNSSVLGKTLVCPTFTDVMCCMFPESDPPDWS